MTKVTTSQDWVRYADGPGTVERIEAYFCGHGYTPHRHDTYAIGITLAGVQRFEYRRTRRDSLPGTTLVLHPDELHDGEAGTEAGFRYRMAYIEPALIQNILGGVPLPFVEGGLSSDRRLRMALASLLPGIDARLDPMEEEVALHEMAHALAAVSGQRRRRRTPDGIALERARHFIHDTLESTMTLDDLAKASGLDRWQLCRDFRALYGTSPYRYLTMRRLDLARRLMRSGHGIAPSALTAGFFDQSHFTRHFIAAYGIAPARWLARLQRSE